MVRPVTFGNWLSGFCVRVSRGVLAATAGSKVFAAAVSDRYVRRGGGTVSTHPTRPLPKSPARQSTRPTPFSGGCDARMSSTGGWRRHDRAIRRKTFFDAADFLNNLTCIRRPRRGIFGEQAVEKCLDSCRHAWQRLGHGLRLLVDHGLERLYIVASLERRFARQHGMEQAAERKQIGSLVHRHPTRLLRRHITRRTDDIAADRQMFVYGERAGHAEIQELHTLRMLVGAFDSSHTLAGLISRCTSCLSCRDRQPFGDFASDPQRFDQRQPRCCFRRSSNDSPQSSSITMKRHPSCSPT